MSVSSRQRAGDSDAHGDQADADAILRAAGICTSPTTAVASIGSDSEVKGGRYVSGIVELVVTNS